MSMQFRRASQISFCPMPQKSYNWPCLNLEGPHHTHPQETTLAPDPEEMPVQDADPCSQNPAQRRTSIHQQTPDLPRTEQPPSICLPLPCRHPLDPLNQQQRTLLFTPGGHHRATFPCTSGPPPRSSNSGKNSRPGCWNEQTTTQQPPSPASRDPHG